MSGERATESREKYLQWRDTYGQLNGYVGELRNLIIKATHHQWLTQQQRDELLAVVGQLDAERSADDAQLIQMDCSQIARG